MKHLFLLLFILVLAGCKKKEISEQTNPIDQSDIKKPYGLLGFSVEGVADENILLIASEKENYDYVVVNLPQNYAKDSLLKITAKMQDGLSLYKNSNALNLSGFKMTYEGEEIVLDVTNTQKVIQRQIHVIVNPADPIVTQSTGHDYSYTIDGNDQYIRVPVQNWGTLSTLAEKDSIRFNGFLSLKNKKTGILSRIPLDSYNAYQNKNLNVRIPAGTDAGEYELTLERNNRKVIVPDAVSFKYGDPLIRKDDVWNLITYKENGYMLSYKGFNLVPGHSYQVELTSDFSSPQRILISPVNSLSLQYKLPADFVKGNYEIKLFIDNKETATSRNPNPNILVVKKDSIQPSLIVLSRLDEVIQGEAYLYKAVTTFNRNEVIIAQVNANWNNRTAYLKNIATEKTYKLPFTGLTTNVLPFPYFAVTSEVPNGRYEVRVSTETQSSGGAVVMSERYHKIITIQ